MDPFCAAMQKPINKEVWEEETPLYIKPYGCVRPKEYGFCAVKTGIDFANFVKKQNQPQPHVNSKARILNLLLLARRVFKLEINCCFKIMASVGLLVTFIGLSSNASSELQGGNLCGSSICHSEVPSKTGSLVLCQMTLWVCFWERIWIHFAQADKRSDTRGAPLYIKPGIGMCAPKGMVCAL